MAQHARIEELSDSASDSDPPEDDLSDYAPSLINPSSIPPPTGVDPSQFSERYVQPPLSQKTSQTQRGALQPSELQSYNSPAQPSQTPPASNNQSQFQNTPPPEFKSYQTIYPLYFDASRTRSEGRRVGKEEAVGNPLAREIVDAVQMLGLKTVFEPAKTHPKDWSNPGRVRVLVKENGKARTAGVKNKHHLYKLISTHLKAHPTTPSTPLRLRVQGMLPPTGPLPPPAVPRGWKINAILPLHSPALSGGGVSENILKDVMQEMQGAGGMPGLPGMGGGGQGGLEGPVAGGKRRREGKKK